MFSKLEISATIRDQNVNYSSKSFDNSVTVHIVRDALVPKIDYLVSLKKQTRSVMSTSSRQRCGELFSPHRGPIQVTLGSFKLNEK